MRTAACAAWVQRRRAQEFAFLTGDLGFRALEPLRQALGPWFINAGVAEQNMIGVAAGLASEGVEAWVYSIAPFCFARPFEQIRNDICLHNLPVRLVGNGGGYAYGVMGATHHALEDLAVMLSLQHMRAFIPAFADDLPAVIETMAECPHPAYLRLGRCEKPAELSPPPYRPWRRLLAGERGIVVVLGPLVGPVLQQASQLIPAERPELWLVGALPLSDFPPPPQFCASLQPKKRIVVVEEHIERGGLGQELAHYVTCENLDVGGFHHLCARGYPSGTYGSQQFHRRECGLDADNVLDVARGNDDS